MSIFCIHLPSANGQSVTGSDNSLISVVDFVQGEQGGCLCWSDREFLVQSLRQIQQLQGTWPLTLLFEVMPLIVGDCWSWVHLSEWRKKGETRWDTEIDQEQHHSRQATDWGKYWLTPVRDLVLIPVFILCFYMCHDVASTQQWNTLSVARHFKNTHCYAERIKLQIDD